MEWFASWFDSPYYHILYADRDQVEADNFIKKLYHSLKIRPDQSILDLACGAGRHAIALAEYTNPTVGIDLSPQSIVEAQNNAKSLGLKSIHFETADMRNFKLGRTFDYVFNLFTSFGYFENKEDNQKTVARIADHQLNGGIAVIDYFNSQKVCDQVHLSQVKVMGGIIFHTSKKIEGDIIRKKIEFEDNGQQFIFEERVQLFEANEIRTYFENVGYEIIAQYGNYQLEPFSRTSDRLILVFRKKG